MYSQYNRSLYQLLRADAEGSEVDCERVDLCSEDNPKNDSL